MHFENQKKIKVSLVNLSTVGLAYKHRYFIFIWPNRTWLLGKGKHQTSLCMGYKCVFLYFFSKKKPKKKNTISMQKFFLHKKVCLPHRFR